MAEEENVRHQQEEEKDEDVEAHVRARRNDEPTEESDDVEAHMRKHAPKKY